MRLIDADDVLRFIEDEIEESKEEKADAQARNNDNDTSYNCGEIQEARRIKRRILESPTIDAAPVVRCVACKRRDTDVCSRNCVYCTEWGEFVPYDGFCHKGAKMDGGADV